MKFLTKMMNIKSKMKISFSWMFEGKFLQGISQWTLTNLKILNKLNQQVFNAF